MSAEESGNRVCTLEGNKDPEIRYGPKFYIFLYILLNLLSLYLGT